MVNTDLHHGHVHNTKLAIASGAAEQNCSSPYVLACLSLLLQTAPYFQKFHSLNDGSQDDWRGDFLQPLSEAAVGITI